MVRRIIPSFAGPLFTEQVANAVYHKKYFVLHRPDHAFL